MKKQTNKGITIISLVVTIIVLMILAGVSISTLVGENGVVNNAKKVQDDTYYQIASEEVNQLVLEYKLRKEGGTLEEFLISKVPSKIDGVTRKDDNTLIVKKNGYEIEVEVGSESKTLILNVVAYIGTYDGQPHDMLTSVIVSPSDAKIEYSIDNGKTYIDEMPQITNVSSVSVIVRASKTGYKTVTATKTAIISKTDGNLILSATSGTYTYPTSGTFTVSGNVGVIGAVSNNTNIATVSVSENTVTVKPGTTEGKATITVISLESQNYTERSAIYEATVKNGIISLSATPYIGTYDGKTHDALTSINVTPSDATLEYSTNGTDYDTTMPTIKNTSSFSVTVRASKVGYKTQSTTETVKVNKADRKLTLSSSSGTYIYPTSGTFTVSGNTDTLSVSSNNNNIATATVNGNIVTVKPGITEGEAIITVTDVATSNYNAESVTYTAKVQNGTIRINATPYTGTYDGKPHNAFTSVTTNPSGASLEYSLNGGTYSTTMPTVTNGSSYSVTVKASKAGYQTKTRTETVKINKAEGSLTLSATSGTSENSKNLTFTVSGNTGTLSVSSNNDDIATATLSGNTVTVKAGITPGTAIITVTSAESTNYNAKTATYTITVKNPIFTENSGVGYYADTDGDGTLDGIIFADLKNGGSGSWGETSYTISTVTGLKEYYVSQMNYNGPFGAKQVLSARGSGNARFNVMAINDYNNSTTYNFTNAQSIKSGDWSMPTITTWITFAGQLGIKPSNYSEYGLKKEYWSSSASDGTTYLSGNNINFYTAKSQSTYVGTTYPVRLVRTF